MDKATIERYSSGLLDFHNHSTASDGGDTPTQLVERAKRHDVSAMALTDHNVISGLKEFKSACEKEGIFAIPFGTEIYAELPDEILQEGENDAPDLILLGKHPKEEKLKKYHDILHKYRKEIWLPGHIEGLEKEGFKIPKFSLEEQASDLGVPSILHEVGTFSDNLEHLIKYVQSRNPEIGREKIIEYPVQFLNRFLYAPGKPAYKKRIEGFNARDAVNLAEEMNCKLFIAHPGGNWGYLRDNVLDYYIKIGVHGIEVRSYFNSPEQNSKFDEIAKSHGLIRSGGSDCHGDNGPFKIGMYDKPDNQLPKDILKELEERLE